jgi:hemolysin activation/secretion protein
VKCRQTPRAAAVAALVALAIWWPLGFAQGVSPGDVRQTLPRPKPEVPAGPPPEVEAKEAPAPAEAPGGPSVLIERIDITGNTVFSTEELHQQIASYEGRRLNLLEIYEIADVLTRYYRDRGYTLSTVTVPAQEVTTGIIKLEVIEGELGQVLVEGNRSYSQSFIRDRLDGLQPGQVITLGDIKQELLTLNDLPGLNARAVVRPGSDYGTSDIVVQANEKRFDAIGRINNHGRKSIGEWRIEGDFILNNPARIGDRLDLSLVHAEAGLLNYAQVRYSAPVNRRGTRAFGYYSYYDYKVKTAELGPAFVGTRLKGEGEDFGVGLTHTFIRSTDRNLFGAISIDRTLTEQKGTLVLPGDQREDITLLQLSAFGNYVHANNAVSTVSALFSTNFRENDDGTENNAQLAKLQIDAGHLMPIDDRWSAYFRGTGVVSADPLQNVERFRIGGVDDVRSYPSAEIAGDQGLSLSAQLQRIFIVPNYFSGQYRAYVDAGLVHRKEPLPAEKSTESLTGVGTGVSLFLGPYISMDLDLTTPLGAREASDRRDTRVWASLIAQF